MAIEQNIGLMFGSFDPPHLGHVGTATKAKADLGLSAVFMLPIPQSPTKLKQPTPFETKRKMCEIIAQPNEDWLIPSDEARTLSKNPLYCLRDLKRLIARFSEDANVSIISGNDWRRKFNLMIRALNASHSLTDTISQYSSIKLTSLNDKIDNACHVFQNVSIPQLPRTGEIRSSLIKKTIQTGNLKTIHTLSPETMPKELVEYILRETIYEPPHLK